MKKTIYLLAALLALLCLGCTDAVRQFQAQTANDIAAGANAGLPVLVDAYRHDGLAVIDAAKTRDDAEAGIAAVKKRWAPRWAAWESVRAAHDAWSSALERGLDPATALAALEGAYCKLLAGWPSDVPALPVAPVRCSP